MALTTSTITGRVPLPDDTAPKAGEITFTLSGFDTEGNQVIPGGAARRYVLEADGSLPAGATLWRNTGGLRGTAYRVMVRWAEPDRQRGSVPREDDLGWVQVGAAASYTLPELLANPASPAPGWYQTVPRLIWEAVVAGVGYSGLWTPATAFPGGAGVQAGQTWLVTAAGTQGGQVFQIGDRLVALINSPSTTVYAGNWLRVASGTPERGSNANGEYVRFADGTLICTRTDLSAPNASTAVGAVFSSGDVAWTFPAAFAATPVVTCAPVGAHSFGSVPYVPTTTSAALRVLSAVTRAAAVPIRAQAIGRWF